MQRTTRIAVAAGAAIAVTTVTVAALITLARTPTGTDVTANPTVTTVNGTGSAPPYTSVAYTPAQAPTTTTAPAPLPDPALCPAADDLTNTTRTLAYAIGRGSLANVGVSLADVEVLVTPAIHAATTTLPDVWPTAAGDELAGARTDLLDPLTERAATILAMLRNAGLTDTDLDTLLAGYRQAYTASVAQTSEFRVFIADLADTGLDTATDQAITGVAARVAAELPALATTAPFSPQLAPTLTTYDTYIAATCLPAVNPPNGR